MITVQTARGILQTRRPGGAAGGEIFYHDRAMAGRKLAGRLENFRGRDDLLVLGISRGGLRVALEIAGELKAPLSLLPVRNVTVPDYPDLAMGAVAGDDVVVRDDGVLKFARIDGEKFNEIAAEERAQLREEKKYYLDDLPAPGLDGRCVILVDEGANTGSAMRAAIAEAKKGNPGRIIVALPVATRDAVELIKERADEVFCEAAPREIFSTAASHYREFPEIRPEEVKGLLKMKAGRNL